LINMKFQFWHVFSIDPFKVVVFGKWKDHLRLVSQHSTPTY
jgi:hypothetical protein